MTLCVCCRSQETYDVLFECSERLESPYGICTHINRTGGRYEFDTRDFDLSMIGRTGANYIRTDFDRYNIQDEKIKELDFRLFDSVVASVTHYKKSSLGIITMGNTPQFSSEWRDYVYETSNRYQNIRYWEIINEIDIIRRYVPNFNSRDYLTFLKEGYTAVKRANPEAKVLFSGLSSITEGDINIILTKECEPYFDIMNVHKYAYPRVEPESFISFYRNLSDLMKRAGIKKPVWVTETGVSTTINGGVSEELQAIWLPRMYLISFACGVDKVFWYKSRSREIDINDKEDCFGLWHKDYSPKPAFYSYKTLTKMCPDGSTRPVLMRKGNIYVASWIKNKRKRVWAVWSSKEQKQVLEINGRYKCFDVCGKRVRKKDIQKRISPSVIYIVGAKDVVL